MGPENGREDWFGRRQVMLEVPSSVDDGAINRWLTISDVIVVVESGPDERHSDGVLHEVHEFLQLPPNPPPRLVVVVSFASTLSPLFADKVDHRRAEFVRAIDSEDPTVRYVIAVALLAVRLQRSGHAGMELFARAARECAYCGLFYLFGLQWTEAMVEANATRGAVASWWGELAQLDDFRRTSATGVYREAWQTMVGAVERSIAPTHHAAT